MNVGCKQVVQNKKVVVFVYYEVFVLSIFLSVKSGDSVVRTNVAYCSENVNRTL